MKEDIEKDIQTIQTILDKFTNEHAIKITMSFDGKNIEYWWNENSFLRSALEQELRNLKLGLLDI
jgi:hypothetical protein